MNIKLVGILFAVGSLLACGDSGTGGSGGGSGGNPPSGGNNTGAGTEGGGNTGGNPGTGGAGGSAELNCDTGCQALFDCGLEGTPPNCVYTAGDSGAFVPGCVEQCADSMALLNFIDPSNCADTVDTIKGLSPSFADVCDNGISQGGAGGGA